MANFVISNVDIHKKLSLKMLLGQTGILTIMVSSVPLISNSSGNEFKQTDKHFEVEMKFLFLMPWHCSASGMFNMYELSRRKNLVGTKSLRQ